MPVSFHDTPFTTQEEYTAYLKLSPAAQDVAIQAYHIARNSVTPQLAARAAEANYYSDPRSLLYGLRDARFVGAASAECSSYASSLSELIKAFTEAHLSRKARADAGFWSFDKVARKKRWITLGVPSSMIVPTLATQLLLEGVEAPECDEALNELIQPGRAIVLKPSVGAGGEAQVCLSVDRAPLEHVPTATGEPRAQPSTVPALPADCVWAFTPKKSNPDPLGWGEKERRTWSESEDLRSYRRCEWFHELILSSVEVRGGPTGMLVVEPLVPHDQELCVLAVNGGAVQVLAGP